MSFLRRLGSLFYGAKPRRSTRAILATDGGSFAVWDRDAFAAGVDLEAELLEEEAMLRHIRAGLRMPPAGTGPGVNAERSGRRRG